MLVLVKYKVKGSTIVEVMVAMAILTFCSSLAAVIYLNIQKSSLPFFKVKAVELAEQCMNRTLLNKEFTEDNRLEEEFTVKKSIQTQEAYPDCYLIRIIVFDGKKKKVHELEQSVFKGN